MRGKVIRNILMQYIFLHKETALQNALGRYESYTRTIIIPYVNEAIQLYTIRFSDRSILPTKKTKKIFRRLKFRRQLDRTEAEPVASIPTPGGRSLRPV